MAVLNREEFFNRVQAAVGTDTSDESIRFIEDMSDTYDSLENAASGGGADWEKKYHELDESWKEKYKHRFFSGKGSAFGPEPDDPEPPEETEEQRAEKITVNDLFN